MSFNFDFYNYKIDVLIPSNEFSYVDITSKQLKYTGTPDIKLYNNATGNLKYTFISTMNLYFNLVSD